VPPEDPIDVASAIREALTNDGLVDRADRLNADISKARLDRQLIRPAVIKMYEQIKSKNK
jgi:hypothetical protein